MLSFTTQGMKCRNLETPRSKDAQGCTSLFYKIACCLHQGPSNAYIISRWCQDQQYQFHSKRAQCLHRIWASYLDDIIPYSVSGPFREMAQCLHRIWTSSLDDVIPYSVLGPCTTCTRSSLNDVILLSVTLCCSENTDKRKVCTLSVEMSLFF